MDKGEVEVMFTEQHILKNHYNNHTLERTVSGFDVTTVDCSADKTSGWNGTTVNLVPDAAPEGSAFARWDITGASIVGSAFKFNGQDVTAQAIYGDKYNPLDLPPYTIRLQYEQGITPHTFNGTLTQVSEEDNIWDWTYENSSWYSNVFSILPDGKPGHIGSWDTNISGLNAILGANTEDVTRMSNLLQNACDVSSCSLFDTRNVSDFSRFMINNTALTSIPPFILTGVTDTPNIGEAFAGCSNVKSGMLEAYAQVSGNTGIGLPNRMFTDCGISSPEGLNQRSQISVLYGGDKPAQHIGSFLISGTRTAYGSGSIHPFTSLYYSGSVPSSEVLDYLALTARNTTASVTTENGFAFKPGMFLCNASASAYLKVTGVASSYYPMCIIEAGPALNYTLRANRDNMTANVTATQLTSFNYYYYTTKEYSAYRPYLQVKADRNTPSGTGTFIMSADVYSRQV